MEVQDSHFVVENVTQYTFEVDKCVANADSDDNERIHGGQRIAPCCRPGKLSCGVHC